MTTEDKNNNNNLKKSQDAWNSSSYSTLPSIKSLKPSTIFPFKNNNINHTRNNKHNQLQTINAVKIKSNISIPEENQISRKLALLDIDLSSSPDKEQTSNSWKFKSKKISSCKSVNNDIILREDYDYCITSTNSEYNLHDIFPCVSPQRKSLCT